VGDVKFAVREFFVTSLIMNLLMSLGPVRPYVRNASRSSKVSGSTPDIISPKSITLSALSLSGKVSGWNLSSFRYLKYKFSFPSMTYLLLISGKYVICCILTIFCHECHVLNRSHRVKKENVCLYYLHTFLELLDFLLL